MSTQITAANGEVACLPDDPLLVHPSSAVTNDDNHETEFSPQWQHGSPLIRNATPRKRLGSVETEKLGASGIHLALEFWHNTNNGK